MCVYNLCYIIVHSPGDADVAALKPSYFLKVRYKETKDPERMQGENKEIPILRAEIELVQSGIDRPDEMLSKGFDRQVVAFAIFIDHPSAMAAMHALNGVKFDPQTGSTLHIEPARSNSRRIQIPGINMRGPYVVIDNRNKFNYDAEDTSSDEDNNNDSNDVPSPRILILGQRMILQKRNGYYSLSWNSEEKLVEPDHALARKRAKRKTTDGAQPCSTLFIANLGPNCTEDELKQVISQMYPGFNTLKVRARGGMPVAFADFEGGEVGWFRKHHASAFATNWKGM
ncbi:hypothetical protein P3S67_032114 [Capsicum chacoense]